MNDKHGKLRRRGWPVCQAGAPATEPSPVTPAPRHRSPPRGLRRARLTAVWKPCNHFQHFQEQIKLAFKEIKLAKQVLEN